MLFIDNTLYIFSKFLIVHTIIDLSVISLSAEDVIFYLMMADYDYDTVHIYEASFELDDTNINSSAVVISQATSKRQALVTGMQMSKVQWLQKSRSARYANKNSYRTDKTVSSCSSPLAARTCHMNGSRCFFGHLFVQVVYNLYRLLTRV